MTPPSPARHAIASGHPEVSRAAATVLQAGGNAFDAAVAAGFASAVAEPTLTSLGGGGFLLARTADGEAILFDFFVDTPGRGLTAPPAPHFEPVTVEFPGATQVFHVGLGSVAVPGCLAGYLQVHRRLGSLPLTDVVAPAVRLARDGVPLAPFQAYAMALLEPILLLTPGSRQLFAPHGRLLRAGETFCNPELADFLEALPDDGGASFYHGALAAELAAEMRAAGGLLGREDLAAYQVIERRPLELSFLGRTLLTNPPPSFGGSLIALTLALLEPILDGERPSFGSADHLLALAAALREVERLRAEGYLKLDEEMRSTTLAEARQGIVRRLRATRGTTHTSICDAAGNAASLTTSNGEGAGFVLSGSGIMLNNMLGEDDLHPDGFHSAPAGERVASMMAPTLLLGEDGPLALGSGGSKRIRTAISEVIVNLVAFGLPLADAVAAPRLHLENGRFELEPGYPDEVVAALAAQWPLNVWQDRSMYFGGVHAAAANGAAAGDERRGGHALVL